MKSILLHLFCISLAISVLAICVAGAFVILIGLEKNKPIISVEGFTYRIYLIDRCQYLYYDGGLAHKGNCTNSIHKNAK